MFFIIIGVVVLTAGLFIATTIEDNSYHDGATKKKLVRIISVIVAVLFALISIVTYVPTGYTGIVTTFGKVHDGTLDAGISFKAPWDNVIRMDNREQRKSFTLDAFSKDIQEVNIIGSVNLNIDKATAMNLYREVGTGYLDVLVVPRVLEDVKAVISHYTAEELIANRNSLSDSIRELLREDLTSNGINIISISIENIDFTDAFTNAVEAKQVATQEKQRAQTQQEQQTMEARQAAERKRIEADANADILKIKADAEAYEITVKAEAEAEANRKIAETITNELIEYTQAQTWDGKLPDTYMGSDNIIPVIQTNQYQQANAGDN